LRDLLQFDQQPAETRLRLIDLNRRSLVGGIVAGEERPSADFIDEPPVSLGRRVFDATSPRRQGELAAEMARFDPALESDPLIDRKLLRTGPRTGNSDQLANARREAWLRGDAGVGLMHGRHLSRFRAVPTMPTQVLHGLTRDLCLGIARLEDLPRIAFAPEQLAHGVPLRISGRTPTESSFWVIKPWERFRLAPALPPAADGLERLHTHLHLTYHYADGGNETLILGLELFHLLLELKDGMQLSGVGEEGIFANLEIFTQRLAGEDARELRGWHPTDDQRLFRIHVEERDGRQVLLRESC